MPEKISNGIKIAVSSKGKNIKSDVSDVFARCPYFIMVEIKDQKIGKIEVIENKNINQMGGVGVATAQLMAEKNVKAVITGNVGPRALDVLKQFNIEIYAGEGVIEDALREFIDGKLKKVS